VDPTLQGVFFLVAIVLWVIAALTVYRAWPHWPMLVALGLALFAVPFCYNAFTAA
jgi:hypothetical protein